MAIGRPRNFDTDQALQSALEVFWRKGYEGASICDLTAAMGINPPSLYAAFGNKESLFRRALNRYVDTKRQFVREALSAPKARDGIAAFLHETARIMTDKSTPTGCLLVQAIAGAGEHAQCIRDEINAHRATTRKEICERLKRAKEEGDLPEGADPEGLARYFATISQGMAVQAATGATRKDLEHVVELALRAWPA